MSTTAPLDRGPTKRVPGVGGAGQGSRAGPREEEGSDSDFGDGGDRPPRGGGDVGNRKPAVGRPAAAPSRKSAVPSVEDIGEKLKDFIAHRGQGLRYMYGEAGDEQNRRLEGPTKMGGEMARKLITEMRCTGEVAKELTVLTLYDVAILIGTFW